MDLNTTKISMEYLLLHIKKHNESLVIYEIIKVLEYLMENEINKT